MPELDDTAYRLSWGPAAPLERRDLPIVFIPETSPEWPHLPAFWTHSPLIPVYIGLPLATLSAIVLADQHQTIRIKVPRGLPDPTPHLPPTNPPTYGRWRLGQKLFYERKLKAGSDTFACASCHKPDLAFTDGSSRPNDGVYNTLSLINVVYNRQQFWDGRVQTLEETLFRGLDDEKTRDDTQRDQALKQHIWGGFVSTLVKEKRYDSEFLMVFGVEHPSQDTVAKALATYLRTILAGDSLFDRAEERRRQADAKTLTAEHFQAALDDDAAKRLLDRYAKDPTRDEMPALLAQGHALFLGKARCASCHGGPLFTDQDYHNIGYGETAMPKIGVEAGRSVHVSVGLKEVRLIGAFRTPGLRNLARTRPYFHDGSRQNLREVVDFFDHGIFYSPYFLADQLRDDAVDDWGRPSKREQQLRLSEQEKDALVMFLRSLEGTPVDPIIMGTR